MSEDLTRKYYAETVNVELRKLIAEIYNVPQSEADKLAQVTLTLIHNRDPEKPFIEKLEETNLILLKHTRDGGTRSFLESQIYPDENRTLETVV